MPIPIETDNRADSTPVSPPVPGYGETKSNCSFGMRRGAHEEDCHRENILAGMKAQRALAARTQSWLTRFTLNLEQYDHSISAAFSPSSCSFVFTCGRACPSVIFRKSFFFLQNYFHTRKRSALFSERLVEMWMHSAFGFAAIFFILAWSSPLCAQRNFTSANWRPVSHTRE